MRWPKFPQRTANSIFSFLMAPQTQMVGVSLIFFFNYRSLFQWHRWWIYISLWTMFWSTEVFQTTSRLTMHQQRDVGRSISVWCKGSQGVHTTVAEAGPQNKQACHPGNLPVNTHTDTYQQVNSLTTHTVQHISTGEQPVNKHTNRWTACQQIHQQVNSLSTHTPTHINRSTAWQHTHINTYQQVNSLSTNTPTGEQPVNKHTNRWTAGQQTHQQVNSLTTNT